MNYFVTRRKDKLFLSAHKSRKYSFIIAMMADIDLYSFLGVIAIILGKVDTGELNIWHIGQTNNGCVG
ncbi:hypothetical protein HMPREF9061_01483 [Actinomyces sp. oral taxon 181 str. F0379]|nr:hypothetical protein HMPREF9061_01483 [Actinomyces sp. oral taxon 181 str. F0379]